MTILSKRCIAGVRVVSLLLVLLVSTFFAERTLHAQATTADIVGNVTDSTGAVLAHAKVTALNTDTGISRTEITNAHGDFTFNLLAIGRYDVSVDAPGFEGFDTKGVSVAAGDRRRVDAKLTIGNVQSVVEVSGSAASLQTDSSTVGTLMTTAAVEDLPTNGRNYVDLVQLVPGVTNSLTANAQGSQSFNSGTRPDDRRQSSAFSSNGQDPSINNNMIDGADNNERIIGTIGVRPSIEAIAEVKVDTNTYRAESGRTAGGVVNVIVKTGTNQFHGSLFEFYRNDHFDANPFYNFTGQAVPTSKPKYRRHQFGGSLGGPIYRDKTFFFVDIEELRTSQGGVATGITLPTALQRVGDFSESCKAGFNSSGLCANPGQQIYMPNAIGAAPAGGVPFNRLNQGPYAANLDPLGLKLTSYLPLPNGPAVNAANYTAVANRTYNSRSYDIKVDHHINASNSVWARYTSNLVNTLVPSYFPNNPAGFNIGSGSSGVGGLFPGPNVSQAQNAALDYVNIIRPTLLFNFRASYTRNDINSQGVNSGTKGLATSLGFPCTTTSCVNLGDAQTQGLPLIFPFGYAYFGDSSTVPLHSLDNAFQYMGSLTWTHGKHNVKAGGALLRRQFTDTQSASARGTLVFYAGSQFVAAPVWDGVPGVGATASTNGAAVANMLLGQTQEITRGLSLFASSYRTWENSAYLQDDWHSSDKLTVNFGIRYDAFTPKHEVKGRISNVDFNTGQVLVPGINTNDTTGLSTAFGDIAPRFGFAATIAPKLVLRGGYGISFFLGDNSSAALLKNVPFTPSTTCGSLVGVSCSIFGNFGTLEQGVPIPTVSVVQNTTPAGLPSVVIPAASTFNAFEKNFVPSYIQQYNLTAEKGFGSNSVSVAYVASLGRHMVLNPADINRPLPSGNSVPNPRPLAALNPNLGTVAAWLSEGVSNYNAVQIQFVRRLSAGLNVNAGYTFQKALDDVPAGGGAGSSNGNFIGSPQMAVANIRAHDYGLSDFDIKHRFYVAGNYALPFGKSLHGIAGILGSGWKLNGIVTSQAGTPFTVANSSGRSGVVGIGYTERPNQVKSQYKLPNASVGVAGQWLDPTAFAAQPLYTIGNEGRNTLRGPGSTLVNLSGFKSFRIYRESSLEFRAEFFNLLNHPTFGIPGNFLGGSNFGQITSLAVNSQPRQLQFALKFLF